MKGIQRVSVRFSPQWMKPGREKGSWEEDGQEEGQFGAGGGPKEGGWREEKTSLRLGEGQSIQRGWLASRRTGGRRGAVDGEKNQTKGRKVEAHLVELSGTFQTSSRDAARESEITQAVIYLASFDQYILGAFPCKVVVGGRRRNFDFPERNREREETGFRNRQVKPKGESSGK